MFKTCKNCGSHLDHGERCDCGDKKGAWMPYSNIMGDKKIYHVGRQLDMSKPLHGGNVEYFQGMTPTEDKELAESIAKTLNRGESLASNAG